jgi:antitoxin component YwqK of YwqJK toxin-antitoxin module
VQFANTLVVRLITMAIMVIGCQFEKTTPASSMGISDLSEYFVSYDSLVLNRKTGLVYHNNEPFSGISVSYFNNNLVAEKINYIDGQRNGIRQKWFANGILSYEAVYTANTLDGQVKSWWSNGKLRSVSNFENGVADGLQQEWYSSGSLFKEVNLTAGIENGLQRAWRENGKIYINYEAKNGRIFGLKRASLCYELTNENIVFND